MYTQNTHAHVSKDARTLSNIRPTRSHLFIYTAARSHGVYIYTRTRTCTTHSQRIGTPTRTASILHSCTCTPHKCDSRCSTARSVCTYTSCSTQFTYRNVRKFAKCEAPMGALHARTQMKCNRPHKPVARNQKQPYILESARSDVSYLPIFRAKKKHSVH